MKNLDAIPGDASPASSFQAHLADLEPRVVGGRVEVAAGNYALRASTSDYAAVEREDRRDLAEDAAAVPVKVGYQSLRG